MVGLTVLLLIMSFDLIELKYYFNKREITIANLNRHNLIKKH